MSISVMIMLSACSQKSNEAAASADNQKADGFAFESESVTIRMHDDMSPILDKLGEPENYAESTSCAFEGLDKIYSYKGFDIYTYPDGDNDYVNAVYFTDERAKTPLGIGIGSSVDDLIGAYGEDYTEEWEVYTYTKDRTIINFISTDGIIEAVEYGAAQK